MVSRHGARERNRGRARVTVTRKPALENVGLPNTQSGMGETAGTYSGIRIFLMARHYCFSVRHADRFGCAPTGRWQADYCRRACSLKCSYLLESANGATHSSQSTMNLMEDLPLSFNRWVRLACLAGQALTTPTKEATRRRRMISVERNTPID